MPHARQSRWPYIVALAAVAMIVCSGTVPHGSVIADPHVTPRTAPHNDGFGEEFVVRLVVRLATGVALIVFSLKVLEWAFGEIARSVIELRKGIRSVLKHFHRER